MAESSGYVRNRSASDPGGANRFCTGEVPRRRRDDRRRDPRPWRCRLLVGAAKTARQQAVTLRGIRLGSDESAVARRYETAPSSNWLCGGLIPGLARTTYVILTGQNTLSITTVRGHVREIALIAGRHPNSCDS